MVIRGWVLLLALGASCGVEAGYAARMDFVAFRPCAADSPSCAPMYLARGTIDDGAGERLAELLQSTPNHPRLIGFDSPGGSVLAGLELGRVIRKAGMDTIVEPRYFLGATGVVLADDAACYSACAYAFMGGVSRSIGDGGRLGVHQFAGLDPDGAEANAQVGVATLSVYMQQMGVDRAVLDLASITEARSMTVVPADAARKYNLDNQAPALTPWKIEALSGGEIGLTVEQRKADGDARVVLAFLATDDPATMDALMILRGADAPAFAPVLTAMIGKTTQPRICITNTDCVTFDPRQPWEVHGTDGIYAVFSVPTLRIQALASERSPMWLAANFPEAYADLDPSTLLSREGFKDGLAVLLKR